MKPPSRRNGYISRPRKARARQVKRPARRQVVGTRWEDAAHLPARVLLPSPQAGWLVSAAKAYACVLGIMRRVQRARRKPTIPRNTQPRALAGPQRSAISRELARLYLWVTDTGRERAN